MLGLSVVPAALQFFGFLFLPESPRWLLQKGETQKAQRVLVKIRGGINVDEEYEAMRSSIEEERNDTGGERVACCLTLTYVSLLVCCIFTNSYIEYLLDGLVLWRMLRYAPVRRALIVGCGLQMFQQLSGINTVM